MSADRTEGAASRRAALEHAADCPHCHREALGLDPSLAATALDVAEPSAAEMAAIRDGVLSLRRVRRVEHESRPRRAWGRVAAVACLTCAVLLFAEETGDREPGELPAAGRSAPLDVSTK